MSGHSRKELNLFFLAIFMVISASVNGKVAGTTNIGLIALSAIITNVIVRGTNVTSSPEHPEVSIGWGTTCDQVLTTTVANADQGYCHNIGGFGDLGATVPALTTLAIKVVHPSPNANYTFDVIVIGVGL